MFIVSLGFPGGSADLPAMVDLGSTPGLGSSPGEGNSYALQCSGLEEPGRLQSTGSQRVRHD